VGKLKGFIFVEAVFNYEFREEGAIHPASHIVARAKLPVLMAH